LSEACEREIMLRAADLVQQWEFADPRDRWKWTGEAPPKCAADGEAHPPRARRHVTPESTVDAFRYLVRTADVGCLKTWLADHPKDAPFLLALLESPAS
jgi:hypothetical protein